MGPAKIAILMAKTASADVANLVVWQSGVGSRQRPRREPVILLGGCANLA